MWTYFVMPIELKKNNEKNFFKYIFIYLNADIVRQTLYNKVSVFNNRVTTEGCIHRRVNI